MNVKTYNFLWGLRMFWRKQIKKIYIDLGALHPFIFLNSGEISNGIMAEKVSGIQVALDAR